MESPKPAHTPDDFDLPLGRLLGAPTGTKLEKQLGLATVGDLLNHFPRRYINRGELTELGKLPLNEDVTVLGRVTSNSTRSMRSRKGSITEVVITDDSAQGSTLSMSFFNGWNAKTQLAVGKLALFSGKVNSYQGAATLTNPSFEFLPDDELAPAEAEFMASRPIPVYPATAKLTSFAIAKSVAALLAVVDLAAVGDPIPAAVAGRERLLPLEHSYRHIHTPSTEREWQQARKRFRYQEALVLQTALARRRAQTEALPATSRPGTVGGLLDAFDARLPFTLTTGQREIGNLVATELSKPHPMHRLLQGEVGSGKTVVALRAMLQVIDSGGQAALLAPTEVLAAQHFASIRAMMGPLAEGGMLGGADGGTQVTLLTGSMPTAARKRALLDAAAGSAGIVIGTHALLSDNVQFADLGLIVVDEQHRFGVEQRDALRAKAAKPPHVLVMTATPIPRTVAMTIFGDLEVSELTELPAGRAPIGTHVVGLAEHPGWVARLWSRSREEIDAGHQVFVVCPKIGTDEEGDGDGDGSGPPPENGEKRALAEVATVAELLRNEPVLAGTRIGILHGKLDPAVKAETMAAFASGSLDLMVSTTVIEVGVDVPNATLMVIVDADRFGISQLHQLRGRVGRGGLPGTCLLVTTLEPVHPSRRRLDAVAATTDGFVLAQEDLALRREGDILGSSQSGGRSALRFLRVAHDETTIAAARKDAWEIVAEDPALDGHQALRSAMEAYLNPEKEAFLERG
ncbi:ATP-dependent DNA helicase RecG [Pseudarthrobacter sp. P1]|uniref:ATP-dependent DNA helicase RecG n=1 Tax=Pseudarthrobacter sp. P1 TaxID=3418418 RepID=UPI003CF51AE2